MRKQLSPHSHFKYAIYCLFSVVLLAQVLATYGAPQALGQNQSDFTILSVANSQGANLQLQYNVANMPFPQAYNVELSENSVPVQSGSFRVVPNFQHQITIVFDMNNKYSEEMRNTYLTRVINELNKVYQDPLNVDVLHLTTFSLVLPITNTTTVSLVQPYFVITSVSLEQLNGSVNALLNNGINPYLADPSDEPMLLKDTIAKLTMNKQIQNTILSVSDGVGLGYLAKQDVQTDPTSALQSVPDNIRIFTIPIDEYINVQSRINRNLLTQIAQLGNGESFELSQLATKWSTIQTILNAEWTISYTTKQTQPFTLGLKIAGIEKSTQITQGFIVPTATTSVPTSIASPTSQPPPPECDTPGKPPCFLLSWWQIAVISILFLALIAWIVGAYFLNKGGGTIISNGKDEELQPVINNQLSHVTLLRVKGSEDSPPKIEINHKYGDEVILGRSQRPPFNIDGTKETEVSSEHCMIRRLPDGNVELELLAKHKWVAIYRMEQNRKTPIILSEKKKQFIEMLYDDDEIHLSETAIYKVEKIHRPRTYQPTDAYQDGSFISPEPGSIISEEPDVKRNELPNNLGTENPLSISESDSAQSSDPEPPKDPTKMPKKSETGGEHSPV